MCDDVENVSALLLHCDAPYIAHLIQEIDFTNTGASRLLTNLQPEVGDRVYCYLYPEDYCMDTVEVVDSGSADEGDSMDLVEVIRIVEVMKGISTWTDQNNNQDEDEVDEELDPDDTL